MTLITFDDLTNYINYNNFLVQTVSSGYMNLNWTNFKYLNLVGSNQISGIPENGMISSPNILFNGDLYGTLILDASIIAMTQSQTFDLTSSYFTLINNNNSNSNLNVKAYDSTNNILHNVNYTLSNTNPLLINFNWTNIYKVTFSSGNWFVMDNLTINGQIVPLSIPSKRPQTINPNTTIRSIKVGQTYQLNPSTNSGQTYFLYKSTNDKVASVDKNGLIKAISRGKFSVQIYQQGDSLTEPINYFLPWFIEVVDN